MQYAELHCKTNFSFLEGASHAEELVARAAELGYAALAVTDKNTLSGVVRAHVAAKEAGFKLLIGAEITLQDAPPVVLWATDRPSYGRLSRLITLGRRRAPKGKCELAFDDLAAHQEGLLAGVIPSFNPEPTATARITVDSFNRDPEEADATSSSIPHARSSASGGERVAWRHALPAGGRRSGSRQTVAFPTATSSGSRLNEAASATARFRDLFGDRCYLLAELHRGPDDARRLDELIALSRQTRLPLVAAGDVHYHSPARLPLQDVLTAIRHGVTVAEAGELLFPNAQRHLKPIAEIAAAFTRIPEAVERTVEIADRCTFSLDELKYEYPEELAPPGMSPAEHLRQLTWQGAANRYPRGVPEKVRELVEHELALISDLRYEAFFLTVWDLVRFARSRGILCQGRGSAANSAVCYCLGVTAVDPDRTDVLFERFISRERNEAPDIDVDFEHERREEVLQYLYNKYGRERAGLTAVVITYRSRSAIRDVGKALGLSLGQVDSLAKQTEGYTHEPQLAERCRQVGLDPAAETMRRLVYLVNELIGFPRHLSQHVGGMVITQGPLCELAPIENAAMPGRTVIEWDKDDLDELGILKVDCLALGMLSAIRKCFDLVKRHHGRELTLADIPEGDEQVYDMICEADTMGVFQIESRAQMSMLPRLRPRRYYDLVIEVAIVRPGPIQGQMVHPYLRRRSGEEAVSYPNEAIREVLHKTLGVPIFQEQAMRLAVVAAGFTPGEADQLRRAMGAWRRPGVIDQFHQKLIEGMLARGLSREFADQVFQQIRGFGEYGFPESHAASFALLVYISAWLKHYYPAAFVVAIINSQPMGFYAPAQLIRDARDHGVCVLPVDVNASQWDCTLEGSGFSGQGSGVGDPSFNRDPKGSASVAPRAPLRVAVKRGDMFPVPDGMASHPDLLSSDEGIRLRLGFRLIAGLPQSAAEAIVAARTGAADGTRSVPATLPFLSLDDLCRRAGLSRAVMKRLAEADAFGSLDQNRRAALWQALGQDKRPRAAPLFDLLSPDEEPPADLPAMTLEEQVFADYRTAGLSLKAHPMSFQRERLDALGVLPAEKLREAPNECYVRVAGLVILRQRPSTAKGITFVTLEDETGTINLVVKQHIWDRYYEVARRSPAWLAHGKLERRESVVHVLVQRLEDLAAKLGELSIKSRDFQ